MILYLRKLRLRSYELLSALALPLSKQAREIKRPPRNGGSSNHRGEFHERKNAPRLLYVIARTSFVEQQKETMNAE